MVATARRLLFLILTGWVGLGVAANSDGLRSAVNAKVADARRVAPELGVHIMEIESGDSVYSFQHETLRIVASNTKLFTSAAALETLGPGFFFETEIVVRGTPDGGTLRGDLAILGGGDPNLSGRWYQGDSFGPFREWAAALAQRGIERIAGELLLVTGLFDSEQLHPDWPRDQITRWYEAPVAALSFNDSCVLVKVYPTGRSGAPARVETVPPLRLFQVENRARTASRPRDQRLSIDRKLAPGEVNTLTVSGRIYRRTESVDKWVAVADPVQYFGAALRQALLEEGIEVQGQVLAVPELTSSTWRPVLTHRSDLLTTLEVINKRSQNLYAESLLKLMGARLCGDGSWPGGIRVVEEFLAGLGIDPDTYQLADGSGMSRRNLFTPGQITHLLRRMFFHRWGKEFLRTLPYSGERDLRWEERLADPPYRGNVFAKTGSLSGVSTLSGYAKARSGKLYAFSILCNRTRSNQQAQDAQDEIVKALVDFG